MITYWVQKKNKKIIIFLRYEKLLYMSVILKLSLKFCQKIKKKFI
jgi:hypothetical protein